MTVTCALGRGGFVLIDQAAEDGLAANLGGTFVEDRAYSKPARDQTDRVLSLTNVVKAMAGTDPSRAEDILGDAQRLAHSISDQRAKARSLSYITRALSAVAPSRAEHLAYSTMDEWTRGSAMVEVAKYWTEIVELERSSIVDTTKSVLRTDSTAAFRPARPATHRSAPVPLEKSSLQVKRRIGSR